MSMPVHVQLCASERTVVHVDMDTKRILGFSPEGFPPSVPPGTRFQSTTLFHASDIEKWAQKFREQSLRDREETSLRRLEAEGPVRKAIKDAIRERNNQLDPRNRHLNNALLKMMDAYYDSAVAQRQKMEVCIAAEKYEADKHSGDIALENDKIQLVH